MIYNEPDDSAPACGLTNFWALKPMMDEFDNNKADLDKRVKPDNKIAHHVEDWACVMEAAHKTAHNP